MQETKTLVIDSARSWKHAIQEILRSRKQSRYEFIRECVEAKVCTKHTGECLLADDGTVTGERKPSMDMAIDMARVAGFDIVLVQRSNERKKS